MSPSPINNPSVIIIENTDGCILLEIFSRDYFFYRASPSIILSVFRRWLVFFISDRISDRIGNYRRLGSRRTDSVGETVGNNFIDRCYALH